jgi:hypothetical protein
LEKDIGEMLLREIEQLHASRLGRIVVKDPGLVRDMRNGREPRPATAAKVRAFMAGYSAGDQANMQGVTPHA